MAVSEKLSIDACVERIDQYLNANKARLPYIAVDTNLLSELKEHMLSYKLLKMQNDIQKQDAMKTSESKTDTISLNRKSPKLVKIVKITQDNSDEDFLKLFEHLF